jgi:glycosyltransferase involved in cell wall biosynthesis
VGKMEITVCLCTFNRDYLIKDAVERVLSQDYTDFELIVVNDCSTDNTYSILQELKVTYPDLIVINSEENKGLAVSRNEAINNSSGTWFTFIDDDDSWENDYLSSMYRDVTTGSGDCIFCGFSYKNRNYCFEEKKLDLKLALLLGFTPPVGAQMYRTSSLKKIGGYNPLIKSGVDHDLWIRLANPDENIQAIFTPLVLVRPDTHKLKGSTKMTLNADKRIPGITNSLMVWNKQLENIGGMKFREHFKSEYRYYLQSRFFDYFLKSGDFNIIASVLKYEFTNESKFKFFVRYANSLLLRIISKMSPSKLNKNIKPLFRGF